mmetsp:Transcript_2377/g.4695  ORF Transcript_2377/g.4695 Transcript_2377/m.4695 type:complete len:89 (+) Transcript_2377:3-269(+)
MIINFTAPSRREHQFQHLSQRRPVAAYFSAECQSQFLDFGGLHALRAPDASSEELSVRAEQRDEEKRRHWAAALDWLDWLDLHSFGWP